MNLVLRIMFFVAALCASQITFAQNNSAALNMVQELHLGDNLSAISYAVAKKTQTYQMIVLNIGANKSETLLHSQLSISVSKYQRVWDKNLSDVWAAVMSPEELESIRLQKQKSLFVRKFASLQTQVGDAMKHKSEGVIASVVSEALNRAVNQSGIKK